MKRSVSRCEVEAWLAVAAWILLIFVTVPVMGAFQAWIRGMFGTAAFLYATIAILLAALVWGIIATRRIVRQLAPRGLIWLTATAAIAIGWAIHLRAQPQEAAHIIEYGVLGGLLANALRHRVRDACLFVHAALAGAQVGIIDELIQWAVPGRYFDFRDIRLNAAAVSLVQIALFASTIIAVQERPSKTSVRWVVRLGITLLTLLGLCLSMTPAAIEAVAGRFPVAGGLIDNQDVVVEYGHRHEVPGIGTFNSRFTLAELATIDAKRGHEVGKNILPASQGGLFPRFLESASRAQYPFAREARLHINSRNRAMNLAGTTSIENDRITYSTRAVRENLLLESFFSRTLEHAKARLPVRRASKLQSQADPTAPFTSKVEPHLVTFATKAQLLGSIIAIVLLLIVINWRLSTEYRSRQ